MNRVIPVIVIVALLGLAGILFLTNPFAPRSPAVIDEPIVDQPEPEIIAEPEPEVIPPPEPEVIPPPEPEVIPPPEPEVIPPPEPEVIPPPEPEPMPEPEPEPIPEPEPAGPEIFDGEVEIEIRFQVYPDEIFVTRGTTVTWHMIDREAGAGGDVNWHNVVETNGLFESNQLSFGNRFSYTFNELGEFTYACDPHPWMVGKIIVVAGTVQMGADVPEVLEGRVEVLINNQGLFSFVPDEITIRIGTIVVWIMGAIDPLYPAQHIIVSDDSSLFESMRLDAAGQTFSFTAAEVGTIRYHCSIHPFMTGTIRVVA